MPRQRRFRRGWLLDIVYWFFTALITKPIAKIGVAIVLLPLLLISSAGSFENMLKGHGPTGPAVADCTGGADGHSHRFYRLLVASRIPRGKTLVVSRDSSQLGGTRALPLFTAYAIFLDANVSWNFGPLRFVLASPRFHRWHHTAAEEGREKNFAGLLPLWDILFGTYYMPAKQPTRFGVSDPDPTDLLGQILWPFRNTAR